ncbi:MAG: caspase family protein [Fulvivirga sp.]
MKVLSSFVFTVCLSISGFAQDAAGLWEGYSTYGKKQYTFKLNLHQQGKVITGSGTIHNKKDSSSYYLAGTVEGNTINLSASSFIYKNSMLHCLPKLNLKLNGNKLEGKYGPNAVWGGCLVSGNINVDRIADEQPDEPTTYTTQQVVKIDDFEGTSLINELKTRNYYALVVAINDYPDDDIPTLSKPISDASQLIQTLQTQYTFKDQHTTFLQNPTRSQLIEAFDKLSKEITDRDNLLIFYAGHGIWDERLKQGFWLPTDASKASKAQWLSNGTIRDYIRAIDSKHTLLITDACFGGSILKERAVFFNGKAMLEMYKRPSRKAMTSGALTTVPDESVFIKYLVKNLTNSPSPLISAEQIFGDFKVAVINNSETGQVPQYGAITLAGDEGGDFIFLRRDALE